MITLFTVSIFIYMFMTVAAGVRIGSFFRRKLDWDEVGVALVSIMCFWFIPITAAMDLGWIR